MAPTAPKPLPPVPEWGARLIRKLYAEGFGKAEIGLVIGYSANTVRKVLRYRKKHGVDRVPQMGKGKVNDQRWVFAGPGGFQALAELEELKERLEIRGRRAAQRCPRGLHRRGSLLTRLQNALQRTPAEPRLLYEAGDIPRPPPADMLSTCCRTCRS